MSDQKQQQQLQLEQTRHYSNFVNSIRAEATKKIYQHYLRKFQEFLKSKQREDLLYSNDITQIEQNIVDYLLTIRARGLSQRHLKSSFNGINHFYMINDINLNGRKIRRFIQFDERKKGTTRTRSASASNSSRRRSRNQGYSTEQIHQLLDASDERTKAIVLMYASTGMRLAALPGITVGDLESVDCNGSQLYQITVYQGYEDDEYVTFCTPECAKVLNSYLDYRRRFGENITDDSPLIREQFDPGDPFKSKNGAKPIAITTTSQILRRKFIQIGVRTVDQPGDTSGSRYRKDVPLIHGFRKFFNTALMNADVNPIIKELLMGHSVRLDDFYYDKNSEKSRQKLLDEYMKAIDNLTISEENRLGLKVQQLTVKADEIMQLKLNYENMRIEMNAMKKKQ